ncbi:MAG: ABC transporter permease [Reinekea sp.]
MKWFILAWQNLGRNRRRTLATLLLIAMGVTGIMTTTGFAEYTYESLREFSMRESGQLILTQPDYFTEDESYPLQYGIDNSEVIRHTLLQDLNISYVLPSVEFNGLISNGDKSTIFMGNGVDVDLPKVRGPSLTVSAGHFLSRSADETADYEVLLGKGLARSLNAELGSGLTLMASTADGALNAVDVQVRGILSTGIPEMDKRFLMVHVSTAQFLLDTERVSQLGIYLRDSEQQDEYQQTLETQYPDLKATPWQERAVFYRAVKNLYDRIFGVMGGVILVMVLFAIFNTSAMSVMERIREIGTLSALGAQRSEIIRLFAVESGLLALLGSITGFVLSGAISIGLMLADVQMPPPPGQTDGYPLQVYFSADIAVYSLLAVLIIACLAALFAVRKGINLSISEALRYA